MVTVASQKRKRGSESEQRGRRAETAAIVYLHCKLYRILARRMRNAAGEIDIVARSFNGTLCFIEVKARPDGTKAAEALAETQRNRIARAAALYLTAHPGLGHKAVRFDVLHIVPGRLPRHLQNAWRLDGL